MVPRLIDNFFFVIGGGGCNPNNPLPLCYADDSTLVSCNLDLEVLEIDYTLKTVAANSILLNNGKNKTAIFSLINATNSVVSQDHVTFLGLIMGPTNRLSITVFLIYR